MTETYVHEGIEVIKTGRTAERKLKTKTAELVEITPFDKEISSWKKWVDKRSLYDVKVKP